eukprot:1349085-Amorphochlora_amoeboformis.AAC.3
MGQYGREREGRDLYASPGPSGRSRPSRSAHRDSTQRCTVRGELHDCHHSNQITSGSAGVVARSAGMCACRRATKNVTVVRALSSPQVDPSTARVTPNSERAGGKSRMKAVTSYTEWKEELDQVNAKSTEPIDYTKKYCFCFSGDDDDLSGSQTQVTYAMTGFMASVLGSPRK